MGGFVEMHAMDPARRWWVRVRSTTGAVCGAGALIDHAHVLTCAHVVNVALGKDPTSLPRPVGEVKVEFPGLGVGEEDPPHVLASVADDGWAPRDETKINTGDIAVLKLVDAPPNGACPALLLQPPGLVDLRARAYGFPARYEERGRVSDVGSIAEVGHGGSRVQLLAEDGSPAVARGYSGGPVLDLARRAVVGIVTDGDPRGTNSFMIRLREVAALWPGLARSIGWRLDHDEQTQRHWLPRAQGIQAADEDEWFFTGRENELGELVTWMRTPDKGGRLVVGEAGSGKSALLARLVTLADPRLGPTLARTLSPNLVPDVGAFALALNVEDMYLQDVVTEIARWLDVGAPTANGLIDELARRSTSPLIAIDQLDAARGAGDLVQLLLAPLIERGAARLLIGLRSTHECPLAAGLAKHVGLVDLDTPNAKTDIARYVRRLIDKRALDSAGDVEQVANGIAERAGHSFLVAQLCALWQCEQPKLVADNPAAYPDDVGGAMELYISDVARRHEPPLDSAAAARTRDLLTALAYARGLGLTVVGPVWPAMASAIRERGNEGQCPGELVDGPARYLMRVASVGEHRLHRLFHPALADCLRAPCDDEVVETRIVAHLAALCPRDGVPEIDPYIGRHLAAHVAAASAWERIASQPHVLDCLEPGTVRSEVLPAALQHGTLPDAITALVRVEHLAQRSGVTERAGLRQLGVALAGGRRAFDQKDRTLWATWWLRSGAIIAHQPHVTLDAGTPVHSLATLIGRDDVTLLAAGCDDGVRLWSLLTGARYGDALILKDSPVRALAATVDTVPSRLAIGSADGTVRLWDVLKPGAPQPFPTGHEDGVSAITASTVGGDLVIFTGGGDHGVRVWDGDGRFRGELTTRGAVHALAIGTLGDTRCLLGGGDDGCVRVWEFSSSWDAFNRGDSSTAVDLVGPRDWVRAVCAVAASNGSLKVAAAGDDAALALWQRQAEDHDGAERPGLSQATQAPKCHDAALHAVAFSARADGAIEVLTGGADACIRRWDPGTAEPIGRPLTGHDGCVRAITVHATSTGDQAVTGGDDSTIRIWHPPSATTHVGDEEPHFPVLAVTALGDSALLTGNAAGMVQHWDAHSGAALSEPIPSAVGVVRALARVGNRGLAVAGDEGLAYFADGLPAQPVEPTWRKTSPGQLRAVLHVARDRRVPRRQAEQVRHEVQDVVEDASVAEEPADGLGRDGAALIVTGGDDGAVRVWDAATGAEIQEARSYYGGRIRGLAALNLDEAGAGAPCVAVVGHDRALHVRSLEDPTIRDDLHGHVDWPMGVCVGQAGETQILITAADDGTVRAWRPSLPEPLETIGRHDGPVHCVARLPRPDGKWLVATGGADRTVRVWRPLGGKQCAVHELRLGVRIHSLCAVGCSLVVGTDEGHIVIDVVA